MHNTTVAESCSDRHWRRNSFLGVFISCQMSFGMSRTAFFVLQIVRKTFDRNICPKQTKNGAVAVA